jgi:hypothetical protein
VDISQTTLISKFVNLDYTLQFWVDGSGDVFDSRQVHGAFAISKSNTAEVEQNVGEN